MAFQNKDLKEAAVNAINKIALYERTVCDWGNREVKIFKLFLEEGVITKGKVLRVLHRRLKELGRRCYEQHKSGQYPDHTSSPTAFAYALLHGEFTLKEERGIKFDHGETKEKFIALYEGNLIESVFDQLTTEKQSLSTTPFIGSEECFESH